jgi:SAM-dependent methyltransferase
MLENEFDQPAFFAAYKSWREHPAGPGRAVEMPAIRALLPPLAGLTVLDLGSGLGEFCREAAEGGAARVVGVDRSLRMIEHAKSAHALDGISWRHAAIEELVLEPASFDLVTALDVLDAIADLPALVRKIASWLRPEGTFLFSVTHPIASATRSRARAAKDQSGQVHAVLSHYSFEDARSLAIVPNQPPVERIHRKVATLVDAVLGAGLTVTRTLEPAPPPPPAANTNRVDMNRIRPGFFLLRAKKAGSRAGS